LLALEPTAGTKGRGLVGRRCPWCWHQSGSGAARRREIALFQGSLLGTSTSGSLMSALWTLGCRWGRRRGTLALGPGGRSCSGPLRRCLRRH